MDRLDLAKELYTAYYEAFGNIATNGSNQPTAEEFFSVENPSTLAQKQINGFLSMADKSLEILG